MLFWKGFNITKNYGAELCVLHKLRQFKDGISFLELKINQDLYRGDHSPKFECSLVLLNYTIFEFNVYYIHHRE